MVSEPAPETITNEAGVASQREGMGFRWTVLLLALIVIGWVWPYDPAGVLDRLGDTGWILSWVTIVVLIGAGTGYVLLSRWAILIAPVGLYIGGVIHWLQYEWGFAWPQWDDFVAVSALALGVLFLTAGLSAGVACRVLLAEPGPITQGPGTVRLSAALAALMGLIAITTINTLPVTYLGGLLGFAAVLAGINVMQESRSSGREHLLAVAGMIFGIVAVVSQVYSLWSLVQDL